MADPNRTRALVDARGRSLIARRGARASSLRTDAYHFLRTASWTRLLLLFTGLFLLVNLAFAVLLDAGGAEIMNAHGLLDDFWFSVQTMGTIGYGYLAPVDKLANIVVTAESFFSILFTAFITGTVFARFSTPSVRIIYSNVMVIHDAHGHRSLQFRMANERETAIVEATIHVYLTREERLPGGDTMRRVYDLPLRRTTTPVFALSFLASHTIDDTSPLRDATPENLKATATNIVVTFTGIDDRLATTVHSRFVWSAEDILFDRKFVDLFRVDERGGRYLDLGPIHDTVAVEHAA
jgi:inward rectifier potassium channel